MTVLAGNRFISANSLTDLGEAPRGQTAAVAESGNVLIVNPGSATRPFAQIYNSALDVIATTDFPSSTVSQIEAAVTYNGTVFAAFGSNGSNYILWLIDPNTGVTVSSRSDITLGFNGLGAIALSADGSTLFVGTASPGGIRTITVSTGAVNAPIVVNTTAAVVNGGLRRANDDQLVALWQPWDPAPTPGAEVHFTLATYATNGTPNDSADVGLLVATLVGFNAILMLDPDLLHVWVAIAGESALTGLPVQKRVISDLSLVTTLTNSLYAIDGFVAPVDYRLP